MLNTTCCRNSNFNTHKRYYRNSSIKTRCHIRIFIPIIRLTKSKRSKRLSPRSHTRQILICRLSYTTMMQGYLFQYLNRRTTMTLFRRSHTA